MDERCQFALEPLASPRHRSHVGPTSLCCAETSPSARCYAETSQLFSLGGIKRASRHGTQTIPDRLAIVVLDFAHVICHSVVRAVW